MILLIAFLLSAVWCDFRTFRIPNRLIIVFFCVGLVWVFAGSIFFGGLGVRDAFGFLISRLLYFVLTAAVMTVLWRARAFGGGDVKLVSVSALFMGPDTAYAFLYALIFSILFFCINRMLALVLPGRVNEPEKRKGLHVILFSLPFFLGVLTDIIVGGVKIT